MLNFLTFDFFCSFLFNQRNDENIFQKENRHHDVDWWCGFLFVVIALLLIDLLPFFFWDSRSSIGYGQYRYLLHDFMSMVLGLYFSSVQNVRVCQLDVILFNFHRLQSRWHYVDCSVVGFFFLTIGRDFFKMRRVCYNRKICFIRLSIILIHISPSVIINDS